MLFKGTLIVVEDCSAALKYYQDMFGLSLVQDNDGNMELTSQIYLQERRYELAEKYYKKEIDLAMDNSQYRGVGR